MKNLSGIFAALLTPFDKNGAVDEAALRQLVSTLIKKGIDGFYVCGSTGEAFLLSQEERKRILSIVVDENRGQKLVFCHIGTISTAFSLELGEHAVQIGVDAISSIPPFYYKFSAGEIISYYKDLASLGTPLIPYNFPSLSGVTLTGDLIAELRKDKNVVGVKFTSSDLFQLERMKKADPTLLVYNGFDEMCLAGLSMGADGAIGSTFNFMPEKFLQIRDRFKKDDVAGAQQIQSSANEVIDVLVKTGKLLNGEKYLLELEGIPFGSCRKPFAPLTEEDKRALREVFEKELADGTR